MCFPDQWVPLIASASFPFSNWRCPLCTVCISRAAALTRASAREAKMLISQTVPIGIMPRSAGGEGRALCGWHSGAYSVGDLLWYSTHRHDVWTHKQRSIVGPHNGRGADELPEQKQRLYRMCSSEEQWRPVLVSVAPSTLIQNGGLGWNRWRQRHPNRHAFHMNGNWNRLTAGQRHASAGQSVEISSSIVCF